ncbi:hypothetical protein [Mucilaginibacter sp.]|uniref:hypothetical protein n=1 Tax=Mucilaginibacter sp. TaxID=1882438 RepID=UPI0025FB9D67|nr:hypothetical protein [Mucilaginibacter sp.]
MSEVKTRKPKQNKAHAATITNPHDSRNHEILNAYSNTAKDLRAMLHNHISKEKQEYVEFQHSHQLNYTNLVREFVCSFCSLLITRVNGEYSMLLIIGKEAYQQGSGLSSNALLRLAFKHTMQANTKIMIENCLDIKFCSSAYDYFKRRMSEFEQ